MSSKEYIKKIRDLLNQSQQTLPNIFQRFYTLLKLITLQINQQLSQQQKDQKKIFDQYQTIYKIVKKYIKDQPYLILNNLQKIQKQLNILIQPLLVYLPKNLIAKKILQFFKDSSKLINTFIQKSQKIKQQYVKKNIKIKVFGTNQLSNSFWINKFKSQQTIHFNIFWIAFLEFIKEINFYQYFITQTLQKSINKIVDKEKKYFVTSTNVMDFFYKLSEPNFLEQLVDETAKKVKAEKFQTQREIDLVFRRTINNTNTNIETNLIDNQTISINGQFIVVNKVLKQCKYPPTIIFGSSVDCDIRVKNNYISRKQFLMIEEESNYQNQDRQQNNLLPFSLVCLSSSNHTLVSYNRLFKIKNGLIFKLGNQSVQIVKQSSMKLSRINSIKEEDNMARSQQQNNEHNLNNNNSQEQDQTLQYLPVKINNLSLSNNQQDQSNSSQKYFQYTFITGTSKGQKGKISKQNLNIKLGQQKIQIILKQQDFYLPSFTQIYIKNANQVINGHLSHKINVQKNMKIILDGCQFQVK